MAHCVLFGSRSEENFDCHIAHISKNLRKISKFQFWSKKFQVFTKVASLLKVCRPYVFLNNEGVLADHKKFIGRPARVWPVETTILCTLCA